MNRIYAKIVKDNKMMGDYIYELRSDFVIHDFFDYMAEICAKLDIPVPMILVKHIKNFLLYNSTTFIPEDFVESFPYDKLIVEIYN